MTFLFFPYVGNFSKLGKPLRTSLVAIFGTRGLVSTGWRLVSMAWNERDGEAGISKESAVEDADEEVSTDAGAELVVSGADQSVVVDKR